MILRRNVALRRAHVDAGLVHTSVPELHLEGLIPPQGPKSPENAQELMNTGRSLQNKNKNVDDRVYAETKTFALSKVKALYSRI